MDELKRTPLYEIHRTLGARMVPFAGFEMPVSYAGIIEEHECVRSRVGLFDVSHMGEFTVSGPDTWTWLDRMMTNDCSALADGGVLYTVMCREDGTVVDDLLVSRVSSDRALVVVNAANIDKDFAHMAERVGGDVELTNESDRWALIAVQGPSSRELLSRCPTFAPIRGELGALEYYHHLPFRAAKGGDIVVSRTGYTGELGFEVFVAPDLATDVWSELFERGGDLGVQPIGLAARDTLRFEAAFCLYGHELDDTTTPLEAGLRWVVKFKKDEFVGREALIREKENGSKKRLVGLELDGRNIARQGYEVIGGGGVVGTVTSGTFSPTLKKSLCMAFVDAAHDGDGGFAVEIRNKRVPAMPVRLPFYASRAR